MDIKPIQPTTEKYFTFGITTKPPVKKYYLPKCWNEVSEGAYKDYSFLVYNNYQRGRWCSSLVILRKLGTWVKSKLKYIDLDGKRKVLWSYRDDKKGI